jgi:hypothetical protein
MTRSFRSQLSRIGSLALDAIEASRAAQLAARDAERAGELDTTLEPPVVARIVVEVRTDGSSTIARGMLRDFISSETHAIEARGSTPAALAVSLATKLLELPAFGRALRSTLKPLVPPAPDDEPK